MANDPSDWTDFEGDYKKKYAPDPVVEIPEFSILQSKALGLDFRQMTDSELGESMNVSMVLQDPQGITYQGESGDYVDLEDALPMIMKQASIKGSSALLRHQWTYKSIQSSANGPSSSFGNTAQIGQKRMNAVYHNRTEMTALYGQAVGGYGEVLTITNVATTFYDVVLTTASRTAFWRTAINGKFEFFNGTTIIGSGMSGQLTKVTTASDGTMTLRFNMTSYSTVSPGNFIEPKTAWIDGGTYREFLGLQSQLQDTTGDYFGLDRDTYTLLQGNPFDASGDAISKEMLISAWMDAVDRGASGNAVAIVPSSSWSTLWADATGLERTDNTKSPAEKGKAGASRFVFAGATGDITVYLHNFVKQGDFFMFSPEDVHWTGASLPTFNIPGTDAAMFFHNTDKATVETRLTGDLAIYTDKPGCGVFGNGVVN